MFAKREPPHVRQTASWLKIYRLNSVMCSAGAVRYFRVSLADFIDIERRSDEANK